MLFGHCQMAMQTSLLAGALSRAVFQEAYARRRARRAKSASGKKAFWQRRYWEHAIRDEADFERHVDYIHINPVKHGYVTRVADWPHSSFHRYVERGLLAEDWGGDVRDIKGSFGE